MEDIILTTELDLSDLNIEGQVIDLGTEDTSVILINGRLGYQLNKYFAVEGEVGFGASGDEIERTVPVDAFGQITNVDGVIDLNVDNYYIGFVRGILPVSEQFDIFARIGYGEAMASADVVGSFAGFSLAGSIDDKVSGVAFGAGAQYNLTGSSGIRADYTRLESTNIISLSYVHSF